MNPGKENTTFKVTLSKEWFAENKIDEILEWINRECTQEQIQSLHEYVNGYREVNIEDFKKGNILEYFQDGKWISVKFASDKFPDKLLDQKDEYLKCFRILK